MKIKNWEYLAGVIDTEGCIMMRTKNRKIGDIMKRKNRENYIFKKDLYYALVSVQVHMTSEKFIKYLFNTYQVGRLYFYEREGYRNDCWTWIIEGKDEVEIILKNILPFLIIKQKQAKLGLKALRIKGSKCLNFQKAMKKLNRRGRI